MTDVGGSGTSGGFTMEVSENGEVSPTSDLRLYENFGIVSVSHEMSKDI